jgi:hypothetical protein
MGEHLKGQGHVAWNGRQQLLLHSGGKVGYGIRVFLYHWAELLWDVRQSGGVRTSEVSWA